MDYRSSQGDEDMKTEQVINEMQELLKENPGAGLTGQGDAPIDPNAAPTRPNAGQDDGANKQPSKPQPINVDISKKDLIDAINATEKYVNTETKVETNDDGILVTVQNKPNQGGKSKKKQMKPKNKSNKKMKNKQTKKGGKQIKKRSLKRKMKK